MGGTITFLLTHKPPPLVDFFIYSGIRGLRPIQCFLLGNISNKNKNSMASLNIPNLPDEILIKIIEMVGEDSFYYLGGFLRAGKRGYALVHEPSVLRMCDVTPMVTFVTCQICTGGQFREFFIKCVRAGNTNAIYYEGLYAALILGVEEGIRILQPNVPNHGLSTLAVGIFNVCIGNDKETSTLFQLFAANHYELRSDAIVEMGADLEWRLISFGAPYMNRYGPTFKFPDDKVIKSPRCLYGHDYTVDFEGDCKNCRLFWICCNISHIL